MDCNITVEAVSAGTGTLQVIVIAIWRKNLMVTAIGASVGTVIDYGISKGTYSQSCHKCCLDRT